MLMVASRWVQVAGGPSGGISATGGTPVARLAQLADEGCAEVWVGQRATRQPGAGPNASFAE